MASTNNGPTRFSTLGGKIVPFGFGETGAYISSADAVTGEAAAFCARDMDPARRFRHHGAMERYR
jgi:hypothetical protein